MPPPSHATLAPGLSHLQKRRVDAVPTKQLINERDLQTEHDFLLEIGKI